MIMDIGLLSVGQDAMLLRKLYRMHFSYYTSTIIICQQIIFY